MTIRLEQPDYTVNEGSGSVMVCAAIVSGTLERTLTFSLTTQDDSATSPADFTPVSVDLTFDESTSRACVDIPIEDDQIVENPEDFRVVVGGDDPDVVFDSPSSTVTIIDNDNVVIGFEMERYQGDEGSEVEVCAIVMDGVLERSALVTVVTSDLSAQGRMTSYQIYSTKLTFSSTAPDDYSSLTAELTFDPANDKHCVMISLVDDDVLEGREELQLSLLTGEEFVELNPDMAVVLVMDTDGEI